MLTAVVSCAGEPVVRRSSVLGRCVALCFVAACAASLIHCSESAAAGGVTLPVSPVPTAAHPKTATPQVQWSTGDGSPGEVTVTPEGSKEILLALGGEGIAPAAWIEPGHVYVFRLYSTVAGRRLIARLSVGRQAAAEVVALPQKPRITSSFVDRVLQVLAFASLLGLALLALAHAREVRRGG
jgi:hypothetical protein